MSRNFDIAVNLTLPGTAQKDERFDAVGARRRKARCRDDTALRDIAEMAMSAAWLGFPQGDVPRKRSRCLRRGGFVARQALQKPGTPLFDHDAEAAPRSASGYTPTRQGQSPLLQSSIRLLAKAF
jgi:hypothetical protein